MKINIKSFFQNYILWTVPFLSFIFGYYILHCFLQKKAINAPNLIGKNLQEGMLILSKQGLNIRLLREQENTDLDVGTILDQTPKPTIKIKPNQHIFVTISTKPKTNSAPDFSGQKHADVIQKSIKQGIHTKTFWLKSTYPKNFCLAQYPQTGQQLTQQKLIAYFSEGKNSLFIFPNLKDCLLKDVKPFLQKVGVSVDIVCQKKGSLPRGQTKIVDQKPMAGSIVDLSKKLYVQLQVEEDVSGRTS